MIQVAIILSTGNELTSGRTVDTNANFIADRLGAIGVEVAAVMTVGDVSERLRWAWETAIERADLVISTGGLGPTSDDLTTETVAQVTGRKLWQSAPVLEAIRERFARSGRQMPPNNAKQALFPEGALIIPNELGTAPGFRLEVERRGGGKAHLVTLPGVPREMKRMMEATVLPWVGQARGHDKVFATRVFQTFGISESALDEAVSGLIAPGEGRVAFRASFPQISLRIVVEASPAEAERRVEELAGRVRQRVGQFVFAEDDATMEEVVARLLAERRLKLALAESCTGGLISHRLTNVPGSSRFHLGSFVTYANELKQTVLGVRAKTLAEHGAVSEPCVREMAAGALERSQADLALAVSGIAGPDGGTPDRPVGTVWFALAAGPSLVARRYQLQGTRDWIKLVASQVGLDWLRRYALGAPVIEAAAFRR